MADETHRRIANLEQKVEDHEQRLDRHDVQIGGLISVQQKFDLDLAWLNKRVEERLLKHAENEAAERPKKRVRPRMTKR